MTTAAPQVDVIPSNERLNKAMTTTPYSNTNDGVGKTEPKNGTSSHSQTSFGEFHLNGNVNGYTHNNNNHNNNNFSSNNARNSHNNYQPQIKSRYILQSKSMTFNEIYTQSSPTNSTVYIGGIMNGLNDEILRQKFIQYGHIVDMRVFKEKGFAFIKFSNKYSATRAIFEVNNTEYRGQIVRCSWGKGSDNLSHGPKGLTNGSPLYSNNTSLPPTAASSATGMPMNVSMSPVIYHGHNNHNYNHANQNAGHSEQLPPTSHATNSTFQQMGPGGHHHAPAFAYPNPNAYQYNPRSVFPYHIHPAIPYHPQATAPMGYWWTAPHGYPTAIGQVPSPSTGMTPIGPPYWFPPAQQIYPPQNTSQVSMPANSSNVHLPE